MTAPVFRLPGAPVPAARVNCAAKAASTPLSASTSPTTPSPISPPVTALRAKTSATPTPSTNALALMRLGHGRDELDDDEDGDE